MKEILKILKTLHPDVNFEIEQYLIDDGILDSLDIFMLVSEIEQIYKIHINVKYIIAENFNSIHAINTLIEKIIQKNES